MKIAFVVDDSLDSTDGVQQYVLTVSNWLIDNGHEVHYITSTTKRALTNLHVVSKKVKVKFNKNKLAMPLPASVKKLHTLLAREHFDVVHIQMPFSPALSGRLIHVLPETTALVGTFHIAPFSRVHAVAGKALGTITKPDIRRFDEIVSVSKVAKEYAADAFNISSTIVPNAVSIAEFTSSKKPVPNRIVFLGRLVPRKGCKELLEAIRILKQSKSNFEVVIAGDGEQRQHLEHYVNKHDLEQCVSFVGFVSEKEKKDLLASATVAVFPALGGESFGIVLLEAMAAGSMVVLAGDNPGYRSVMGSIPEAMVNPKNSHELSAHIERMLNDQVLREKISTAQQKLVKAYDINTVGQQITSMYARVIEKRRAKVHNT